MMKNIRKILALVLSLALVLALVACGGKAPEAGAQAGAEAPAAGEEAGETTYPVVKIVFTATQEPTETAEIEAFVNERLRERYGVEVSFTYIPFGDLQTSVNLMLTGGDEVDLFTNRFMGGMTLSSMSANGQIIPLNDLLEQYGQGIMGSAAADYLDCVSIDGKIWGVPSMGAFAAGNLYLTRKDVADAVLAELGWTMEDVCDYETLTTYMIKAKEMFPEYYYVPGSTAAGAWYVGTNTGHIDNLGVGGFLAVLDDPTNSTTVVNYYASEDYYNACVWAKQWKDAGLILPDPMNAAEALKAQLQKGQLGGTHSGNYSAAADAASYSSSFGFDCVAFTLGEPLAITSYVSGNAWCISSTCKNPEAAMKVLNALYCDADIATAVMNGLEGLDYVVTENGTFTYPEGKGIASVGWTTGAAWYWPNQTLGKPWEPNPANTFEDMLNVNNTCAKSLALGFTPDLSSVTDQITSCTNVIDTYSCALLYAEVDLETVSPQFLAELEAAGINDIIAEVQSQLDAWLAAQG